MDVFSVFPNAVIGDVWEIGEMRRSTEIGKTFDNPIMCDVIVDEEQTAAFDTTPQAESSVENTLIYAKPEQMPTLNTRKLQAAHLWHNTETDEYFEIQKVGVGRNQETGEIEHLEFSILQTEIAEDE